MPNPKGNPQNLKAPKSTKEAQKKGRKGGIKSGQVRAAKKSLREHMQMLLDSRVGSNQDGTPVTGSEAMALAVFEAALAKDWKAWELARDTSGQKCAERVIMASVDLDTIQEVEYMVLGEPNKRNSMKE